MTTTDSTCGTCRFADTIVGDDSVRRFDCHRYPPGPVFDGREPVMVWPQVDLDDWCGEHLPVIVPDPMPVMPLPRIPLGPQ